MGGTAHNDFSKTAPHPHKLIHRYLTKRLQWDCSETPKAYIYSYIYGHISTIMDVQIIGDVPATQAAGVLKVGVCKERTYRRLVSPSARLIRSLERSPLPIRLLSGSLVHPQLSVHPLSIIYEIKEQSALMMIKTSPTTKCQVICRPPNWVPGQNLPIIARRRNQTCAVPQYQQQHVICTVVCQVDLGCPVR
jgi:hypothetical protein